MDMSIIIPCHNLEKFIYPILYSIKEQIIPNNKQVEVIFICDACIDKTKEIIEQFELPQYEKIVLECNHKSCGLARNEGLNIAKGNLIWFMDGDDWLISALAISIIFKVYEENNFQIAVIDYEAPNFHAKGHFSMVWQYIYKRDFIGDIRFEKVQPNEDVIFNKIILSKLQGKPIVRINHKLYHYNYMREGSNMHQLRFQGKITS